MSRHEFTRYLATLENTEGYSEGALERINAAVFAAVADLDADDINTKSTVDHAFEREFARY